MLIITRRKYPIKRMLLSIDMQKTGVNIKKHIRESGYSVREIMEITGITAEQTVYKWYRGESLPSLENLLILCRLFGTPVNRLLVLKEPPAASHKHGRLDPPDSCVRGVDTHESPRVRNEQKQLSETQIQRLRIYYRNAGLTA